MNMCQTSSSPIMDSFLAQLPHNLRAEMKRDVPLRKYCSYRVGAEAQLWFEPKNEADLLLVLRLAQKLGLPRFILGNGSNVIPPDSAVAALVIHFAQNYARISRIDDDLIDVQAGAMLAQISRQALQFGRRGVEWMVDIPASLGGAVLMNAGNNEGTMADCVRSVRFLDDKLKLQSLAVADIDYAYRHSRFKNSRDIILSAEIKLAGPDSDQNICQRMQNQRDMRRNKFPTRYGNAGSVFKRPAGDYAGRLIEASGLKGLRIGDAQVSEKHAGFIINLGQATATDIARLIKKVQQVVFADSAVMLETEQIFFAWDPVDNLET